MLCHSFKNTPLEGMYSLLTGCDLSAQPKQTSLAYCGCEPAVTSPDNQNKHSEETSHPASLLVELRTLILQKTNVTHLRPEGRKEAHPCTHLNRVVPRPAAPPGNLLERRTLSGALP